jgi:hypothetical protein
MSSGGLSNGVTSNDLLRAVREEGRHVGRARFGAAVGVAYHAVGVARDDWHALIVRRAVDTLFEERTPAEQNVDL